MGLRLWSRQREVLEAVAGHDRVAVRSGHKVGKSTSAAALALWYVATRPDARVIMTSASGRQVKNILWRELKRLHKRAKVRLGGVMHDDPNTGYRLPDGREILGFSTDEPEKMAGISGASVLFILDEASGIDEPIFEAIEGNRAGGAKIVMFSNPTRTSGTFYEAFTTKRQFWHCIKISSTETPNVQTGRAVIPGLATRDWVNEKALEWGKDHPLYEVRVAGDFPSQTENTLIGLALVEAAIARWPDTSADGALDIGVDVARFGDDDSVITARRGNKVLEILAIHGMDGIQIAGKTIELAKKHRHGEPIRIKVDVIGVGASVVDQLNYSDFAKEEGVTIHAVNVASAATSEEYPKLRDQIWFATQGWLKDGGSIPSIPRLEAELVAVTYKFDAQGRQKVESKDEMKKRLKCSTDYADSLGLSIYQPPEQAFFIGRA